jgi:rRNA maturation protein Nop10
MGTRSERSNAPKPDPKAPAPAVKLSECPSCGRKAVVVFPAVKLSECPSCGRKAVVVFPVVTANDPDGTHRFVCVHCCPKPPSAA